MYDNNKKDLFKVDARLRVREIIDLKDKSTTCELTYKNPLTRKGIKVEEEIKVNVNSYPEIVALLGKIGFFKVSSYERIRTTYLTKDVELVLDDFPFGTYLEIEGETERIKAVAKQLGLEMGDNITQSCDDLYAEIQRALGRPIDDHIKFIPAQRKVFLK